VKITEEMSVGLHALQDLDRLPPFGPIKYF